MKKSLTSVLSHFIFTSVWESLRGLLDNINKETMNNRRGYNSRNRTRVNKSDKSDMNRFIKFMNDSLWACTERVDRHIHNKVENKLAKLTKCT